MAEILLVADEPWVLDDVRAALSDPRHTIHELADPRSVLETIEAAGIEVVVVDLQVGSMGGMAVTRSVRDRAAVSGEEAVPVIMLLDRDADAFLAGRSGAAAWVRKPFAAHLLREAIDRALLPTNA